MIRPSPPTPPPYASIGEELISELLPLLAEHRQRWAARCQAHGLSIVGFQVLALLEIHGPMPMSVLADQLGVALPNATGIVSRLAERGIVERAHDEADRRVVRVTLTDRGSGLIAEMESARRERLHRLVGVMDRNQQQRLLQAVRDLRAAAAKVDAEEQTSEPE